MKLAIENTEQLVEIVPGPDVVRGRVWVGRTEQGVEVQLLVLSVAVPKQESQLAFERELDATPAPRPAVVAWPLCMFL